MTEFCAGLGLGLILGSVAGMLCFIIIYSAIKAVKKHEAR